MTTPTETSAAPRSALDRGLAWASVLGVLLAVFVHLGETIDPAPRQARGWGLVALLVVVGVLVIVFVTREGWDLLRGRPGLLVPLGLLAGGGALLALVERAPGIGEALATGQAIWFFEVSALVFLHAALYLVYGTWTTLLLLDVARGGSVQPGEALRRAVPCIPRVFVLEAAALLVMFLGVAVMLSIASVLLPVGLLGIAVVGVVLNAGTAALLLVGIEHPGGSLAALAAGVRASCEGLRRWWAPLLAQLLVLGLVTVTFISQRSNLGSSSATHFTVNAFWAGGYEDSSYWYSKYAEALGTSELGLATLALGLVLGVLALTVKLTIARRLRAGAGDQAV